MSIPAFLSLVEIQTKLASVIPFLLGTAWAYYRFGTLKLIPMLLLFLSMVCFDMLTTGLNNYFDWKRAERRVGYNYERHNAIVHYRLSEKNVLLTLSLLLIIAIATGLLLLTVTDWIVLAAGVVCFAVGILYSAGPLPISRTPLGEAFSGVFMGFFIPFLAIYVHTGIAPFFRLAADLETINLSVYWMPTLQLLLLCAPPVFCIANIMLANNICDMHDDMENKRFTFAILAGKPLAMVVFHLLYLAAAGSILVASLIGALPLISLASLLVCWPIMKNLASFRKLQTKKDTFGLSVQNFVLLTVPNVLILIVASFIH